MLVTILGLAAGFVASAEAATATKMGVEQPSSTPIYMQPVVQGCFSSAGDLVFNSTQPFNSRGQCGQTICQAMGKWVAASTQGSKCYCGDSYPPKSNLVDDKFCDTPCTGFGTDACGGSTYFTVYNTGLQLTDVPFANESSSTSSSTASSKTASTTVIGGQTVFVTQTSESSTSKKSNTAGIAAGVVVGVVVIGAAVGAGIYIMRRRRNREIEADYRRNAAVNAFFDGSGKSGTASDAYSNSDSRLDPVMSQRRMSDGSIADNQDYSRRILRVCSPHYPPGVVVNKPC